ncbi:hypothetical protein V1264_021722 [Littorina saxatilis]|uniref:DDE Tnp4 domain-containing protein n=2 Tax=Littorina saxatilis TaxID=31220 RepID=A0AAN9FW37_9CAEN
MPVNKEVYSFLAETIGIILGEFADDPPEVPHKNMILKEAEYLCKKSWTRSSIAGHIAVKYGGAGPKRSPVKRVGARSPIKKLKTVELDENGQPVKKPRKKKPPAEKLRKPKKEHKPKLKVWRRSKTPRKKVINTEPDGGENEGSGVHSPGGEGGGEEEEDKGLTDTEVMLRELEKIPYFRDPSFKDSFHMERSTFQELCQVVGFKVAGRTVSPYSKLLGVLWWLAGRESMKQIVKRFDWSIGTFHGAVHLFSTAIVEHLMPQTIRWPSGEDDVKQCLLTFEQNYNFQGVMGCLGACRLPLRLRSAKRGAPYRDPNGRPSILLQAVCDANRRFLHVSAGWPGTTAEHVAFHESDLPGLLDKLPDYAQVLASRDYPARNHVWIPFSQNAPMSDEMFYFNRLHAASMVALDRTTLLLKNTFQRLELLEMLPDKIPSVVLAACALINFILEREDVGGEDRFPVLSGSGFDGTPGSGASSGSTKKKKGALG